MESVHRDLKEEEEVVVARCHDPGLYNKSSSGSSMGLRAFASWAWPMY